MCGRGVGQIRAEELAQRTAVRTAPGDAALTVDPFKVADEEHAEVRAGRNRGPSTLFVVRLTQSFDKAVESGFGEHRVELGIERMRRRFGQRRHGNEQIALLGGAFSQRHVFLTLTLISCSKE